jgi:ribosomal protein S18 acetylase RimI-like enzyme
MTTNAREQEIEIRRLGGRADAEISARMMANSEPWITLRRDYDASLKNLTDPSKEVYLALEGDEIAGFTVLSMQGGFVGYLQSVCVAPRWRGKGFGSKLMDYVEKRILSETPNVFMQLC